MIRGAAVLFAVAAGLVGISLTSAPCAAAGGLGMSVVFGAPAIRNLFGRAGLSLGRVPWPVMTLSVVSLLSIAVLWGVPAADALGILLVYLQIHNRVARLHEADDRTAVLLAVLMLAVGASATRDPLFAAAGGLFAASLPVALSTGPMRVERALSLSLAGLLLSAALFIAAPRARLYVADRAELTGFSSEVELGALDALFDDPTIVFRAAVRPASDGAIYWRGLALDQFDGSRWSSGSKAVPVSLQPGVFPHDAVVVDVETVEPWPMDPAPLFTAGWPLDIRTEGVLLADGQGGFARRGPINGYRLTVQGPLGRTGRPSTPVETDPEALVRARQLPEGLDPRIAEIARQEAGEGSTSERIERLARFLGREFAYTRRPKDAGTTEPLSVFLFERRAGHCEYFAASLAVLARTVGIPARIVNGFVGGRLDPESGWWIVRRSDAHTWVEYHDQGWVLADPTPGPASVVMPSAHPERGLAEQASDLWEEAVLSYDRRDQLNALLQAASSAEGLLRPADPAPLPWRGLLLLAALAFASVLLVRVLLRALLHRLVDPKRTEPHGPIARVHHRAREHVARCGYAVPPALPPVEAARWVCARAPCDASAALLSLAWLYYGVHLGGDDPAPRVGEARALLERVRKLPVREDHRDRSA